MIGWVTVGVASTTLLILLLVTSRDRLGRYEVAIRGNSATNRHLDDRVDAVFYTRFGARRYARLLNSGATGTAIFKAEVRRRG